MEIQKNNVLMNASNQLDDWILKSKKSVIFEIFFGIGVFSLFGILVYLKSSNNLLWLIVGFVGLLFYVGLYIYGGTIRRGKIINNTAKLLIFRENSIGISTYSYNILGLINFSKKEIEISRVNLIIKECDYAILDKKTINGKVLYLSDKNQQGYYIIPQFYPEEISVYLKY